jgi:Flp pilus assembly protein TadG
MIQILKTKYTRRATTVVEMAVMAPLFLAAMMGMIEIGYAFMVKQTVTSAAREGARAASLPGGTMTDVQAAVDAAMQAAHLEPFNPPPGYDPNNPGTCDDCGYTTTSNVGNLGNSDTEVWVNVSIPLRCASVTGLITSPDLVISTKTVMRRESSDQ